MKNTGILRLAAVILVSLFLAGCTPVVAVPGPTQIVTQIMVVKEVVMVTPTALPSDLEGAVPVELSVLNPMFKWYNAGLEGNTYSLPGCGRLLIHAVGGTEMYSENASAPVMALPVQGDFDARVRMSVELDEAWQFAGLGVRSAEDPSDWVRVGKWCCGDGSSPQRIGWQASEDFASYQEDMDGWPGYPDNNVFLRIVREGNQFSLYSSPDGENWVPVIEGWELALPQAAELMLLVYSTEPSNSLPAEFWGVRVIQ